MFLKYMINDEKLYSSNFFIVPSSLSFHHSYEHGNLQHAMEVYKLCTSEKYQHININIDQLSVAALFHDFYKIHEYPYDLTSKSFVRSKKNTIKNYHIDHMVEICNKLKCYNLAEMFGSHHGMLEWGAVSIPESSEAKILFASDLYSATVNQFN